MKRIHKSTGLDLTVLAATIFLLVCVTPPAMADEALSESGQIVLDESREPVKTETGREIRRFRTVYDADRAVTMRETYDDSGKLLTRRTLGTLPAASEADLIRAERIVRSDPAVQEIFRRQAGLDLAGGFVMRQAPGEGPCVAGTRCVQMFLFDGENVVRHMLVDLRAGAMLVPDYQPPRNRKAQR